MYNYFYSNSAEHSQTSLWGDEVCLADRIKIQYDRGQL